MSEKLTLDEALAILDRQEAEEQAKKKPKKPTPQDLAKEAFIKGAGMEQGLGGLNLKAKKQLEKLEEEGY